MKNINLEKYKNHPKLSTSINERINEVMEEEEAYAADELVELAECILSELAAVGFATYLLQPKQKEVFNDYLIQLFSSRNNAYNAGPLYRWSANMIKDAKDEISKKIYSLFWEEKDGKNTLREKINQLSELRNEVMHGFFVLPPERNQKEATTIAEILEELVSIDVFSIVQEANYHFLKSENNIISFEGNWEIQDKQWEQLNDTHSFGNLSNKIREQLSNKFEEEQDKLLAKSTSQKNINTKTLDFINNRTQGAVANWYRPNENYDEDYSRLVNHFKNDEKSICVYHNIEKTGISHTGNFLINRMVNKLSLLHPNEKTSKNNKKALTQLIKKTDKKVVVILNNIHQSLFHSDHVIKLADFLFNNNIIIVTFGICHPWMNQFFNMKISSEKEAYIPSNEEWTEVFTNYLRYKGPNLDLEEEKEDYKKLKEIINLFTKEMKSNKIIIARRFADEHKLPIEFVHEVFDMFYPYFNYDIKDFEMDKIDPLYDFPEELTESSRVLFSIGRRDTKLEYQHKTLSL